MRELKIYLAGKMAGLDFTSMNQWRKRIKNALNLAAEYKGYKLDVVNPVDFYNL